MRLSKPHRWIVVAFATLFLTVGIAGPALAADPTPEQKAQAARVAGDRLCKDGILGTVLVLEEVKVGCASIVASVLVDHGRNVTTTVLCTALAAPAGVGAIGVRRLCEAIGRPLVDSAIGFFEDALKVAGAVIDVAKFVADPTSALDNFANTLKVSATDLIDKVLRELSKATAFDAGASWWLRHYAAAAALGLLVMAVMMLITAVQTARNQLSGDEMHDTVFKHLPTGILLMVFGPALGAVASTFANELTDGIVSFIAPDMGAFLQKLNIFATLTATIPGGVVIGIVIYLMLFGGALTLLGGLLLQTVTLYFTGLACGIAFGMWVNPKWRKKVARIPLTWVGIVFAKPLVFMLLGAAFGLANFATSATAITDPGLKSVTTALMAAIALLVAGMAPFGLLKYAPLLPDGSDSVGSTGDGVGGDAVINTASSVTQQIAMRRAAANNDSATRQEASVRGDGPATGQSDPASTPDPAATSRSTSSTTSDPNSPSTGTGANTGTTTGGTNTGSAGAGAGGAGTGAGTGVSGAGTGTGAGTGGAGTGAGAGASGAGAGAGVGGAGTGGAAAAGAGAATGGVAFGVIATAEVGRAALDKARSIADNAPPEIPAKDGD